MGLTLCLHDKRGKGGKFKKSGSDRGPAPLDDVTSSIAKPLSRMFTNRGFGYLFMFIGNHVTNTVADRCAL